MVHLMQIDKTPSGNESALLSTVDQKHPSRRILVVDDDPDTRQTGITWICCSHITDECKEVRMSAFHRHNFPA